MKIISFVFLTIFLGKGCDDEQKQDLESAVIEYTANTRGFYQRILVENQTISVTRDRQGNEVPTSQKLADKDQKEILASFKDINLDELPNLKAPTEKRYYDGAAIGNLKVTYKGKIYETSGFDHGFPPVEIERLVNKLNALVKSEQ